MMRFTALILMLVLGILCFSSCQMRSSEQGSSESQTERESESESLNVTEIEGLRVLAVGDTHCTTGTDERINSYIKWAGETFGYENTERMGLFVDSVLAEHEKEPIDLLLVLGDLANNDKPFQYYYKTYMNSIKGTSRDRWYGDWKAYMMDEFYASENDSIYDFKVNYLDRIADAGIPYYVVPGNHDAYTDEMWEACFSAKYGDNGELLTPSHIGEYGEMDYIIELPEKDTAIIMLNNFAYDEAEETDNLGNSMLGPRYQYYMTHDNVAYTPLSTDETRVETFKELVREARGYQHLYIASHYFSGLDVVNNKTVNDNSFIVTEGDKYGNLRAILYGHDQGNQDRYITAESGKRIYNTCVQHFVGTFSASKVEENGKTETVCASIAASPWGFSDIRHAEGVGGSCRRISVEANYEFDEELAAYYRSVHPEWDGKYFMTPFEKAWYCPYSIGKEYTIFTVEE